MAIHYGPMFFSHFKKQNEEGIANQIKLELADLLLVSPLVDYATQVEAPRALLWTTLTVLA